MEPARNARKLSGFAALIALCLFLAVTYMPSQANDQRSRSLADGAVAVDLDADTTKTGTAQLAVGQELQVSLVSNPTTGFSWVLSKDQSQNANLLQTPDKQYVADSVPEGTVGSGGKDYFTFTALSPGQATLVFLYKRSWEPDSVNTATVTVTIT